MPQIRASSQHAPFRFHKILVQNLAKIIYQSKWRPRLSGARDKENAALCLQTNLEMTSSQFDCLVKGVLSNNK